VIKYIAVILAALLVLTQFVSGENNSMKMEKQMGFGGGFSNKNNFANGTFVYFKNNGYGIVENYSVNGNVIIKSIDFVNTTNGEWYNRSFMDIYENRFFRETVFDNPMGMITINTKSDNVITIVFNSKITKSTTFNGAFINNNGMLALSKGSLKIKNSTAIIFTQKNSKILIIFNNENYLGKFGLLLENFKVDGIITIFSGNGFSYNQTIILTDGINITKNINGNTFIFQISSEIPKDIFLILKIYPPINNMVVKIDNNIIQNSTLYQTVNNTESSFTNENINNSMVMLVHLSNYTYHSLVIYSNIFHSTLVYYITVFGSIFIVIIMAYFVYRKSR